MNNVNNCDWETNVSCFIENVNESIKKHKLYDSTDYIDVVGIGYLVADLLKWKCRYVVDGRRWYWYSDGYWKPDNFNIKIKEYIKIISDSLLALYNFEFIKARMNNSFETVEETIQKLSKSEETKIFLEWKEIALILRESKSRNKVIKELPYIDPLYLKDFNTSPYLLNCANCTIDLIKKEVLDHNPEHLLINMANVEYDKTAKCEDWVNFIKEMMQSNEENIQFLQKIVGYFLTGNISYERFLIFQGETNHKNIFIETILQMLGNYVVTLESETLSAKNGNALNELSRIASVRLVNVNEIPKGMELNSALINRIINGNAITVKDKHNDTIEIKPQCKICLTTNFLPNITDEHIFKSGKINKLKLNGKSRENKELKNSFQEPENLSGILNWALEGLDLLNAEGLQLPANIVEDINEYRGNIDIIEEFIQSCFIKVEENYKEQSSKVYEQYKFWCRHNEFYYDYPQKFWAEMVTRVRRTRSNKGHVIWGYKLISNYSWENPSGDDYGISDKLKFTNDTSSGKVETINRKIANGEPLTSSLAKEKSLLNNNELDYHVEVQTIKTNAVIDEIMNQTEKDLRNEIIDNVESSPDSASVENVDCESTAELLDPFEPIVLPN